MGLSGKVIIAVVIVVAIIGVASYFLLDNTRDITYEEYDKKIIDMIYEDSENKVYPYYVNYDININPPKITTTEIMRLNPERDNFCLGCVFSTGCIFPPDKGYFKPNGGYYEDDISYSELISRAAIYRIEVDPTFSKFLYCNDFFYIYSLDDKPGKVENINVELDPSESTILNMQYKEALKATNFYKKIELEATHQSLNKDGDHCIWFVPMPLFHNNYTITVPNRMVNYTIDTGDVCVTLLNDVGNKIIISSDCKPFHCFEIQTEGRVSCKTPKIEICFN